MGNAVSPLSDNMTFATVAMSRYLSITKEQVFAFRREALSLASYLSSSSSLTINEKPDTKNQLHNDAKNHAYISREKYINVLQKAKILHQPDMDVLLLLFTILDTKGTNFVNVDDMCIGLSLFASCKTNTTTRTKHDEYNHHLYSILKFAIEIYYYHSTNQGTNKENGSSGSININGHMMKNTSGRAINNNLNQISKNAHATSGRPISNNNNNNDRISLPDAISVLQSMNLLASLLGDNLVDQNQLSKLVRSAFEENDEEKSQSKDICDDKTYDGFCQSFCKLPVVLNLFSPRRNIAVISSPLNIRLPTSKSIVAIHDGATSGFPDSAVKGTTKTAVGAATAAVLNITSSAGAVKKGITTISPVPPQTLVPTPETKVQILESNDLPDDKTKLHLNTFPSNDLGSNQIFILNASPKHQNMPPKSQMFQPKSIMKIPQVAVNQNNDNGSPATSNGCYRHVLLPNDAILPNHASALTTSASAFASFISSTRQKPIVDYFTEESMGEEDTTSYEVTTDIEDDRTDSDTCGPRPLPSVTTTRVFLHSTRYHTNHSQGGLGLLLPRDDDEEDSTANARYTFDDLSSKMSKKMTPLAVVQVAYSSSE